MRALQQSLSLLLVLDVRCSRDTPTLKKNLASLFRTPGFINLFPSSPPKQRWLAGKALSLHREYLRSPFTQSLLDRNEKSLSRLFLEKLAMVQSGVTSRKTGTTCFYYKNLSVCRLRFGMLHRGANIQKQHFRKKVSPDSRIIRKGNSECH